MIDAGWPDTLPQMLQLLRQNDIFINDIDYLIITHFHPDHSGLTQNLKDYGTKLILHECQVSYVNKINSFFKKNPKEHFKDIVTGDNIVVSSSESRSFLKEIGIDGEIIQTPGHSDDSISLVVDDCCAFTGDLADLSLLEEFHDPVMNESWERIKKYNVKMIYPGHRNPYPVE
jgi:glyoxylase-like metal-dependent hydrolase (beta-lactamase superfamily II)